MKFKTFLLLSSTLLFLAACSDESESSEETTSEDTTTEETSEDNTESTDETETSEEGTESNSESGENLLDIENSEAGWINFAGELKGSPDYRVTPELLYDPSSQYELNIGAYVSYFSNGEFLETVQTSSGPINQVEGADSIRVSYHNSFEENISLTEQ